ncbi:MAG: lipid II flippase MurJ [Candidatus Deferrimicrobiaceae bacterium]
MKMVQQTAIRGVFSVGMTNLMARVFAFGKHLVIAAYIGLSAGLDAFYVATAVLSIGIFAFGDIFDSLGIPRLVGTLQTEGEEKFKEFAGSILSFAVLLSIVLCTILLLIAPWTPRIAPGFTYEKKAFVLKNLFFLAPMALLYLPYHAMGSFLRARRRFQVFYVGEFLIAFISLLIIFFWHDSQYIIPISFSAAYVFAFLYVAFLCRHEVRLTAGLQGEKIRGIIRMLFHLLPIYIANYLFVLVDRGFASYLQTGGVSALSYGVMIVVIPTSILMLENIFITPLAESSEKGEMMRSILIGTLILSVPIAFFVVAYANPIVKAAFERGVFTAGSTKMTADALAYYALSIPVIFVGPVCIRLFQILEELGKIAIVSLCAVVVNALLNLLFLKAGMGIKGIALASSISWYGSIGGYLYLLRQLGIPAFTKKVGHVLLTSLGISAGALGITFVIPYAADSLGGLIVRGVAFVLLTGALVFSVPNEEFRYWRETVCGEILVWRK